MKVIRQKDYDTCVENGFPPDFFRQSFFDHVTMYCVPDGADFCGSTLQDCEFSVCGIRNASFLAASIYSTDFHSSLICETNFHCATLAHSHFYDCDLLETSFNDAYLKSSNTIDCALSFVRYAHATLDGCSFGRVKAHKIFGFDTSLLGDHNVCGLHPQDGVLAGGVEKQNLIKCRYDTHCFASPPLIFYAASGTVRFT